MEKHQWTFQDRNQTVIICHVHPNEKKVLTPTIRNEILKSLVKNGEWAGPELHLNGETYPPSEPQLPTTEQTAAAPHITYQAFSGLQVEISIRAFKMLLCPDANNEQAYYMMKWCEHNRIDPFANEAHFAVMDGKPVIQVSKDAWFRRIEANPRFVSHDGGLIVETSMEQIKEAVLAGMDDYLVADVLKQRLLADFAEGKSTDPKGAPSRLTCRKRGIFLSPKDTLIGGWAEVHIKDRPHPYRFEVDKAGWQTTTREGKDNVFWSRKAPFMAWKSALKNCCRLAFPELSGLMNVPEHHEEEFDPAESADYEVKHGGRTLLQRRLFALGNEIPPPCGPFKYPELHALSLALYDGRGISELSQNEMGQLIQLLNTAKNTPETLTYIDEVIRGERSREVEGIDAGSTGTGSDRDPAGAEPADEPFPAI